MRVSGIRTSGDAFGCPAGLLPEPAPLPNAALRRITAELPFAGVPIRAHARPINRRQPFGSELALQAG